jgi:hypothetical protein
VATFVFPESATLRLIEQDYLPRVEADRPVFEFFPVTTQDAAELAWEIRDNYVGIQQVRGLNGEPPRVKKTGLKRFVMEPGVYGEYEPIPEADIVRRRKLGSFADPIDLGDLVGPIQVKLLQRRYDRLEWMIWTLLATGTFSVAGPTGAILHTDSYTTQTFSAVVPWSTFATATPMADFSSVQLLGRGHSVDFGAGARAFMNRATFNNLRSNTNNADIYGRRTTGLGTYNAPSDINTLFQGDDLPGITVYDRGYFDETNTFQLFIPNNKVIVVGKRPMGEPVGSYVYTRNINQEGGGMGPGAYTRVIDLGETRVPREFHVHDGHSGGVQIYWPSAIVVMTV